MRLIDADTSIESIRNLIGNGATLEQAVDAQPTAYDVDKVAKKISDYYDLIPGWALKEIIEIVKVGGVNE